MRDKLYIILPSVLAIYAIVMAWIGRSQLFDPSTRITYRVSVAVEVLVLVLLYFFLKKRGRLRRERMEDLKKQKEKKD